MIIYMIIMIIDSHMNYKESGNCLSTDWGGWTFNWQWDVDLSNAYLTKNFRFFAEKTLLCNWVEKELIFFAFITIKIQHELE